MMRMDLHVRVLLLEDDLFVGMLLQEALRQIGAHVRIAPTLSEARRFLARQAFDVVFCDMELPDGNGVEIFMDVTGRGVDAYLMTSNPRPAHVPVERFLQKPDVLEPALRICHNHAYGGLIIYDQVTQEGGNALAPCPI